MKMGFNQIGCVKLKKTISLNFQPDVFRQISMYEMRETLNIHFLSSKFRLSRSGFMKLLILSLQMKFDKLGCINSL